jgi:tetratricopeptide (TPR) repeat protein
MALGLIPFEMAVSAPLPDELDPKILRSRSTTTNLLIQQATSEAAADRFESAVVTATHAIEITDASKRPADYNSVIQDRGLIITLEQRGHASDAEKLLILAVNKLKSLYGADSSAADGEEAQLFSFYIREKEYPKALKVLDVMLAADLRKIDNDQFNYQDGKYWILTDASTLVRNENQKDLAMTILNKELAAQRRCFGDDDCRVEDILEKIADIEAAAGDSNQAISHYKQALAIEKLYGADRRRSHRIRACLANLLDKEGDRGGATRVIAAGAKAEKLDDKWRSPAHSTVLPELLRKYTWGRKEAPYSRFTAQVIGDLLAIYEKKKDWTKICDLVPEVLNILDHNSSFCPQGCNPQPTPAALRTKYYNMIVEAYTSLNNPSMAKSWTEKAASWPR